MIFVKIFFKFDDSNLLIIVKFHKEMRSTKRKLDNSLNILDLKFLLPFVKKLSKLFFSN